MCYACKCMSANQIYEVNFGEHIGDKCEENRFYMYIYILNIEIVVYQRTWVRTRSSTRKYRDSVVVFLMFIEFFLSLNSAISRDFRPFELYVGEE